MHAGLTREFIERIPKTDLHLHLDGSLRIPTLIELAQAEGVELPSYEEAGLRETVFKDHYENLGEYLQGFAYTCAVMRNEENLERVAFELGEDNLAENVRYLEIRFAPQLHAHDELSMRTLCKAVARGLERAQRLHNQSEAVRNGSDLPFHYGIICCAMRAFTAGMSPYFKRLFGVMSYAPKMEVISAASVELARAAVRVRDEENIPIVGFDLAGEESGFPAHYHTDAYHYAHTHFLRKTVHAGEAYGPESIFQAITDCHANRIGHGTFLFRDDMIQNPAVKDRQLFIRQLSDYIASQRITIEACLTSNLQTTPQLGGIESHPVKRMLSDNLAVSICTDNRLVSNTTPARELELLATHLPITRRQFRNVIHAGFKGAFFPHPYREKREYVRNFIDIYERLEREMLPPDAKSRNPDCGDTLCVE